MQERGVAAPLSGVPPAATRRRRPAAAIAGSAAAAVAVDQATKEWALRALDGGPIDLVWTLRLRLIFNDGGAFGIGGGNAGFFVVMAAVVVVVLAAMGRGLTGRLAPVALGLVLGGALGNLADRLFRDTGGAVVDFVDLQWWPVFNLADAAIVVGAGLLVLAGPERR